MHKYNIKLPNNKDIRNIRKEFLKGRTTSLSKDFQCNWYINKEVVGDNIPNISTCLERMADWTLRESEAFLDTHIKDIATLNVVNDSYIPKQVNSNNISIHPLLLGKNISVYNDIIKDIRKLNLVYNKDPLIMLKYNNTEDIKRINNNLSELNIQSDKLYLSEDTQENTALDIYVAQLASLYYKLPDIIRKGLSNSKELYDRIINTFNSNSVNATVNDKEGYNYLGTVFVEKNAKLTLNNMLPQTDGNTYNPNEGDIPLNNVVDRGSSTTPNNRSSYISNINGNITSSTDLLSYISYPYNIKGVHRKLPTTYNNPKQGVNTRSVDSVNANNYTDINTIMDSQTDISIEDILSKTMSFDGRWKQYVGKPNKLNLYTSGNTYNYTQPLISAGYIFIHSFETLLFGLLSGNILIDYKGDICINKGSFIDKKIYETNPQYTEYTKVTSKFSCINTPISIYGEYYGDDTKIFNRNRFNEVDKDTHLKCVYPQKHVDKLIKSCSTIRDSLKYSYTEELLYKGMGTTARMRELNYVEGYNYKDPYNLDTRLYLEAEYKAGTAVALLDVIANMCGIDNVLEYIAYLISIFDYYNTKINELMDTPTNIVYNYELVKAIIQPDADVFELVNDYRVNKKHVDKVDKTLPKKYVRNIEQKALYKLMHSMLSFVNTFKQLSALPDKKILINTLKNCVAIPVEDIVYNDSDKYNKPLIHAINSVYSTDTAADTSAIISYQGNSSVLNSVWDSYWGQYTQDKDVLDYHSRAYKYMHIDNATIRKDPTMYLKDKGLVWVHNIHSLSDNIQKDYTGIYVPDENISVLNRLHVGVSTNLGGKFKSTNTLVSNQLTYKAFEYKDIISGLLMTSLVRPNKVSLYTLKNMFNLYYKTPILLTLGIDHFSSNISLEKAYSLHMLLKYYNINGIPIYNKLYMPLLSTFGGKVDNISIAAQEQYELDVVRQGTSDEINYIYPSMFKNNQKTPTIRILDSEDIFKSLNVMYTSVPYLNNKQSKYNINYFTINNVMDINSYMVLNNEGIGLANIIDFNLADPFGIHVYNIIRGRLHNTYSMSLTSNSLPSLYENIGQLSTYELNDSTSRLQGRNTYRLLDGLNTAMNLKVALTPYMDIQNSKAYTLESINTRIPTLGYEYVDKLASISLSYNGNYTGIVNSEVDYTNFNQVTFNKYVCDIIAGINHIVTQDNSNINSLRAVDTEPNRIVYPKYTDIIDKEGAVNHNQINNNLNIGNNQIDDSLNLASIVNKPYNRTNNNPNQYFSKISNIINTTLPKLLKETKEEALKIILENGIFIEKDIVTNTYYIPSSNVPLNKNNIKNKYSNDKYATYRTNTFNNKDEIKDYIIYLFEQVYGRKPTVETNYVFDLIDKDIFYSRDFYKLGLVDTNIEALVTLSSTYTDTFFYENRSRHINTLLDNDSWSSIVRRHYHKYSNTDVYISDLHHTEQANLITHHGGLVSTNNHYGVTVQCNEYGQLVSDILPIPLVYRNKLYDLSHSNNFIKELKNVLNNDKFIIKYVKGANNIPVECLYNPEQTVIDVTTDNEGNVYNKNKLALKSLGFDTNKVWKSYITLFTERLKYINNTIKNNKKYAKYTALLDLFDVISTEYKDLLDSYTIYIEELANVKDYTNYSLLEMISKLILLESIRMSIILTQSLYDVRCGYVYSQNISQFIPNHMRDIRVYFHPKNIQLILISLLEDTTVSFKGYKGKNVETYNSLIPNMYVENTLLAKYNYIRDLPNGVPSALLSNVFDYNLAGEYLTDKHINKIDFYLDMLNLDAKYSDLLTRHVSNYSENKEHVLLKHKNLFIAKNIDYDKYPMSMSFHMLDLIDNLSLLKDTTNSFKGILNIYDDIPSYTKHVGVDYTNPSNVVNTHVIDIVKTKSVLHSLLTNNLTNNNLDYMVDLLGGNENDLQHIQSPYYYDLRNMEAKLSEDTLYTDKINKGRWLRKDLFNIFNTIQRILNVGYMALTNNITLTTTDKGITKFIDKCIHISSLYELNKHVPLNTLDINVAFSITQSQNTATNDTDNNEDSIPYLDSFIDKNNGQDNFKYTYLEDTIQKITLLNRCLHQSAVINNYKAYKLSIMQMSSIIMAMQDELINKDVENTVRYFNKYIEEMSGNNVLKNILLHYYTKLLYTPGTSALAMLHKIANPDLGLSTGQSSKENILYSDSEPKLDSKYIAHINKLFNSPLKPVIINTLDTNEVQILGNMVNDKINVPNIDSVILDYLYAMEVKIVHNKTDIIPSIINNYFGWRLRYEGNTYKDTYLLGSIPQFLEAYIDVLDNQNKENKITTKSVEDKGDIKNNNAIDATINKFLDSLDITDIMTSNENKNSSSTIKDSITELIKPRVLPNNLITTHKDNYPLWTNYIPELMNNNNPEGINKVMGTILTPWVYKIVDIINSIVFVNNVPGFIKNESINWLRNVVNNNPSNLLTKILKVNAMDKTKNKLFTYSEADSIWKLFEEISYEDNKLALYIEHIRNEVPGITTEDIKNITDMHKSIIHMIYIAAIININILRGILYSEGFTPKVSNDIRSTVSPLFHDIFDRIIEVLEQETPIFGGTYLITRTCGSIINRPTEYAGLYNYVYGLYTLISNNDSMVCTLFNNIDSYNQLLDIASYAVGCVINQVNTIFNYQDMVDGFNNSILKKSPVVYKLNNLVTKLPVSLINSNYICGNKKALYPYIIKDTVLSNKTFNSIYNNDIGAIHIVVDVLDNSMQEYLADEGLPSNNLNVLVIWNKAKPDKIYPYIYFYGIHFGIPSVYIMKDKSSYDFILSSTNFDKVISTVLNRNNLSISEYNVDDKGTEVCDDPVIVNILSDDNLLNNLFTWSYPKISMLDIEDSTNNNILTTKDNNNDIKIICDILSNMIKDNEIMNISSTNRIKHSDDIVWVVMSDNINEEINNLDETYELKQVYPFILHNINERNMYKHCFDITNYTCTKLYKKDDGYQTPMVYLSNIFNYSMNKILLLNALKSILYHTTVLIGVGSTDLSQIVPKVYDIKPETTLLEGRLMEDTFKVLSLPTTVTSLFNNDFSAVSDITDEESSTALPHMRILSGTDIMLDINKANNFYANNVVGSYRMTNVNGLNDRFNTQAPNVTSFYENINNMPNMINYKEPKTIKDKFSNIKEKFNIKYNKFMQNSIYKDVYNDSDIILNFNSSTASYENMYIKEHLYNVVRFTDVINGANNNVNNIMYKFTPQAHIVRSILKYYFVDSKLFSTFELRMVLNKLYNILLSTHEQITSSGNDSELNITEDLLQLHKEFEGLLLSNTGNVPIYNK